MKIPQALCTVPEDFVTDFYMISSYQQEEELYYMEQKKNLVTLGSTGITVEKNSFGALPIQRISKEAAIGLLRKGYAAGVKFYFSS